MSDGIYAALSGAVAQETALEYTAQNLANASTSGFRGSHPVFHEVLARATAGGPSIRLTAITGARVDTTAGAHTTTGRPLDVALAPGDFLAVSTTRGERYTRAGAMRVAADGALQASSGDPVLGEDDKPIRVDPNTAVTVTPEGAVLADGSPLGRLKVVTFARPEAMTAEGATLLAAGGAGAPVPSSQPIEVGVLEGSNASTIHGMTEMLQATRTFEAFQRAIDAFHNADQKALQIPKS
jgi:flagellar basal body rod protein FlgG